MNNTFAKIDFVVAQLVPAQYMAGNHKGCPYIWRRTLWIKKLAKVLMKASLFETLPHLPKTILAKDVQPLYHVWLP